MKYENLYTSNFPLLIGRHRQSLPVFVGLSLLISLCWQALQYYYTIFTRKICSSSNIFFIYCQKFPISPPECCSTRLSPAAVPATVAPNSCSRQEVHVGLSHCPKNYLNLRIKTEPVTAGADATVYVRPRNHIFLIASVPAVTGSLFYAEIQIFFLEQSAMGTIF